MRNHCIFITTCKVGATVLSLCSFLDNWAVVVTPQGNASINGVGYEKTACEMSWFSSIACSFHGIALCKMGLDKPVRPHSLSRMLVHLLLYAKAKGICMLCLMLVQCCPPGMQLVSRTHPANRRLAVVLFPFLFPLPVSTAALWLHGS